MEKWFSVLILLCVALSIAQPLRVVTDKDYPPFTYIDESGSLVGASVEIWKLWSERTGIPVELIPLEWEEAIESVKRGGADAVDLIFFTPERESFFDFSFPIYEVTSSIYYRNYLPDIDVPEDLTPYIVGIKAGDALYNILSERNPDIQFRFYRSYSEIIEAFKNQEIEVFAMDDPPAQYYLVKHDLIYDVDRSKPFTRNQLHWAVKNGNTEILSLLNDGLSKISDSEIKDIIQSVLPSKPVISPDMRRILFFVSLGVLITFVALFAVNLYLRSIVKKTTKELREKNEELALANEELESQIQETRAINEELETAYNELEQTSRQFRETLRLVSESFNLDRNEEDFLKEAFELIFDMFPQASQGYVSMSGQKWRILSSKGFDKSVLNRMNLDSSEVPIPDKAVLVENIRLLDRERMSSRAFKAFEEYVPESKYAMIVPIRTGKESIGEIVLELTKKGQSFSSNDLKALESIADIISSFYILRRYSEMDRKFRKQAALILVKAMEYHDNYTRGHSQRVAEISAFLAESLGLDKEKIYWAALLHDIGKIGISQHILNKEGPLDEEEFELIKQHPIKGYELIKDTEGFEDIAKIVLHHHERWDGNGYPAGLKDGEIPLESRIIFLADSFDAMTSVRSYRKTPLPTSEALEEIKRCSGTQFDPEVVKAFLSLEVASL